LDSSQFLADGGNIGRRRINEPNTDEPVKIKFNLPQMIGRHGNDLFHLETVFMDMGERGSRQSLRETQLDSLRSPELPVSSARASSLIHSTRIRCWALRMVTALGKRRQEWDVQIFLNFRRRPERRVEILNHETDR
jgi:hypothetical protein